MRIWGVMIVRNAVDLVAANLRHHVAVGLERVIAVDNGSTDGTWELLAELAETLPIDVSRDLGPYDQSRLVNAAVRAATAAGADWVVPIDVDEFFVAPAGLAAVLAETDAAALEVEVVNFVQRREERRAHPRCLLTMGWRPEIPLAQPRARALVEAGRRALVEVAWERSVIARASPNVRIAKGNHYVTDADGPTERTSAVTVLHAPLRAREVLERRLDHARRLIEAGEPRDYGWHIHTLPSRQDELDALWAANSTRDGALEVVGVRRPLVRDERLIDAVAPHV